MTNTTVNPNATIPNHYTNTAQWTIPLDNSKIHKTGFTHQTALGGTEDYAKWTKRREKMYATPVETALVRESELVVDKPTRVRKGRRK